MGRKKRKQKSALKPFCYYCDREFKDEKMLIQHQQVKHLRCPYCSKKMVATKALGQHVTRVHNMIIKSVPNAKKGQDSLEHDILGMQGVPDVAIQKRKRMLMEKGELPMEPLGAEKKQKIGETSANVVPGYPNMQPYNPQMMNPQMMMGRGMPPMMGGVHPAMPPQMPYPPPHNPMMGRGMGRGLVQPPLSFPPHNPMMGRGMRPPSMYAPQGYAPQRLPPQPLPQQPQRPQHLQHPHPQHPHMQHPTMSPNNFSQVPPNQQNPLAPNTASAAAPTKPPSEEGIVFVFKDDEGLSMEERRATLRKYRFAAPPEDAKALAAEIIAIKARLQGMKEASV